MRTFDEEVHLIGLVEGVDDEGFNVIVEGKKPPILANKLSVRSNEYWQAKQSGISLSYTFEVHAIEYNGEEKLMYDDDEYRIERTYEKGDYVELICVRKADDHAT